MFQVKTSESTAARRRFPVYLVDGTDGNTPETGITFSAGDIKVSKNGAAEANHAGTVSELAGGLYYYEATSGELDTVGFLTIRFVKSGVKTFVLSAQVVSYDPYDSSGLGLSRIDATIGSRATQTSVDTLDDFVDTEVAAIKAKTDNLPSNPAAATDIPSAATISTTVWGETTRTLSAFGFSVTVGTNNDKTGYALTSGERSSIADSVWDEALSGHLTAGSTGNALGAAGDPWSTVLPGAYGTGTAGKIIGDNINGTILSRASQTSLDTVDTVADAIKLKTDNLPSSPASTSDIPSAASVATAVWNNATRTLSSFGTLVSDVWANATRTLSAFGFTVTTDVSSTVTTNLNAPVGNTATPANVLTQVNAALDAAQSELTATPTSTGSLRSMLRYLFAKTRNRIVVNKTNGTSKVYREDSATELGSATFTDNGTILDKVKDA